jgi:rhomboid family protein
VLIWWFGVQVIASLPGLNPMPAVEGGVAVWAHIGGFVAGVALVKVFESRRLVEKRNEIRRARLYRTV